MAVLMPPAKSLPELPIEPCKNLGDLVKLLKLSTSQKDGLEERYFHASGIASIEVAATALRFRGYKVEVLSDRGAKRMRLLEIPSVGARKRKALQERLC